MVTLRCVGSVRSTSAVRLSTVWPERLLFSHLQRGGGDRGEHSFAIISTRRSGLPVTLQVNDLHAATAIVV